MISSRGKSGVGALFSVSFEAKKREKRREVTEQTSLVAEDYRLTVSIDEQSKTAWCFNEDFII